MKNCVNETHIEGILYEHDLELKKSGPNSKNPGTEFITGTISIATDNAGVNIVPVHFTYVTATTSKGTPNATFNTLSSILNGAIGTKMKDGPDKAAKIRVDSTVGLNEFYSDRSGKEELISVKRNEGGFVHIVTDELKEDEKERNTFKCDMLITGCRRIEADPDKNTPEKLIVKGAIFDFRKALLPVEFTTLNPNAMNYFESLEASQSNPVFTKVWGRQISETIVNTTVEESAFGDPSIKETKSTYRDFIITGAITEPYLWDDESTMTSAELTKAIADRELYLAGIKQRRDEYKASKGQAPANIPTPVNQNFKF